MTNVQGYPLEVALRQCRDLREVGRLGKQHPYCIISWSQQKHRSHTHTGGGKDPVWNQTFSFTDVSPAYPLRLEFFDENVVLRDKAIGDCKINLNKVFEEGSVELKAPVFTSSGKQKGECHLVITARGWDRSQATTATTTSNTNTAHSPGQSQSPMDISNRSQFDAVAALPVPKTQSPMQGKFNFGGILPAASGHVPSKFILPQYANTQVWNDYTKGKLLGKGNFGKTYLAVSKATGKEVAVKVIAKRMLSTLEAVQDVRNEVEVMHHLAGHPNVVNLEGVYEDINDVSLVMEVMRGGDLFDAICKKGGVYTEKDAAALARDIVSVIAKCHAESVVHRDIKPHNFLLTDHSPNAKLKAADFGLSSFFKEGQKFTDIVGSLYYMAPEVLKRSYSKEADIWSCGVILYILLSGRIPFGATATNEEQVFDAIQNEPLDLQSEPWDGISEEAKDCIRRMLRRDPDRRAKASDILANDWLRENGCASDNVIEVGVVSRMKQFNQGNKLKKAVTQMMVSTLPLDEIKGLRTIFASIDQQKTGRLTLKQFADALKQMGTKMPEAELRAMWKEVDHDGDGTLLYEEFIAATIHSSKLQREDRLKEAFIRFDADGDGFIGPAELRKGLKQEGIADSDIEDIIRMVDRDGSGTIDYNEFVVMMRGMD